MIKNEDICQVKFVDQKKVGELRRSLKGSKTMLGLSEIFRVLGDPTRLKICLFLSQAELCVCDIAAMLEVSESAVSHQLRLLRSLRLVKYRREGKMAFYTLDDDHVMALIKQGLEHVEERRK